MPVFLIILTYVDNGPRYLLSVFILVSYFLGLKSKYYYFSVFMLFANIGSAECIRFGGQLLDVLFQIPFQTFFTAASLI